MSTLWAPIVVVMIVVVVAAVATYVSRRHGGTMVAVHTVEVVAGAVAALSALGLAIIAVTTFTNRQVPLADNVLSEAESLTEGNPCPGTASDAPLYCAGTVMNAPLDARLLYLTAMALLLAASFAICWAIYMAARHAVAGDPFHRNVIRAFVVAGWLALLGGIVGEALRSISMTVAVRSLPFDFADETLFYVSIPWWPCLVSLGCFAMAAIFRHGARLQAEAARLQKETEGLV
ncbi:hypothetical protein [Microbacterium bovistercoris]|nr:hypothetical protein [Microbacterium bovistercoris]